MLGVDGERLELARAVGEQLIERGEHHVLERRCVSPRFFERREHRNLTAAAQRGSGRDRDLGLGVAEALRDGGRGEAGENGHLDGADVCAGVRSDGRFRRHGQVGDDTVTGLDAEPYKRLGEPSHSRRELGVRQRAARAVLAAEHRCRRLGLLDGPAVDAVPRDVQLAADEPRRPLRTAGEVDHLPPWLGELDPHVLDGRRPEPLGVVDRTLHELAVVVEAVTPHQPDDIRALQGLRIGLPHHFGHGASLVWEGLAKQ